MKLGGVSRLAVGGERMRGGGWGGAGWGRGKEGINCG